MTAEQLRLLTVLAAIGGGLFVVSKVRGLGTDLANSAGEGASTVSGVVTSPAGFGLGLIGDVADAVSPNEISPAPDTDPFSLSEALVKLRIALFGLPADSAVPQRTLDANPGLIGQIFK